MINKSLVDATINKIVEWNKRWPRSVVLWSGGKDSTALLHLIKFGARIDLPVIQYREPKMRERYAYSDKLIKEWNLEVYDYPPSKVAIADGPDVETGELRFDFIKYFQWGQKSAVCLSLGTERPKEGEEFLCAVTDLLQRPTGSFNWPWGAVYIGTKYSDTDLIKGHVPLAVDIRYAEDSPMSLYPLRGWNDKDIFDYLEENNVTPDPTRYVKNWDRWENNKDKSLNADFYPVCFNCVNRHAGKYVECPKLKATISNISHLAPYEDLVNEDLGFRPVTWNK